MAEASWRASRRGPENAVFVVASAERPPRELAGLADELTIQFPWGSLLRGALGLEGAAAAGIAALVAPGGLVTATLSIEDRDGLDLPALDAEGACDRLRDRWSGWGLDLVVLRRGAEDDLTAMRSTWGRRLAAGRDRTAWRIELRRPLGGARDVFRAGR